jgi:hypothetical protein
MTWRPSHEWDWRGGCTKSVGFVAVHQKTVGATWLSHKTKTGGSAETGSVRAEKLRSGWHTVWSRCLRWEDVKARWMRGRPLENFMCWPKYPCEGLSCKSYCRGTSVFSRGPIYRRRGLNFQSSLCLVGGVLFHFRVFWGERVRGESGSLFELFAIQDL